MAEQSYKTTNVYGNSRELPLTYQLRNEIDERFVNDLTRDKHIILHGGSKQGKTCMRKYHLKETECIVVQCTRDTSESTLYEMMLKKAGVSYEVTQSKTTKGTHKISVTIKGKGKIPFLAEVESGGDYQYSKEADIKTDSKSFEIDVEDVNDIVRALQENDFNLIIVIEDFHYLDEEVQQQFAFDLKVFHETSKIVFIVIGVWQESNKLILYNGDLTGRVTNINVDQWNPEELEQVVKNGYPYLNIGFPTEVIQKIVSISEENVGLLQEICYRLCEKHHIWLTQLKHHVIGSVEDVEIIAKSIADDQAARYRNFLVKFSQGLGITELEIYKWLLFAIIHSSTTELRNGLKANQVFAKIKNNHPKKDTLQQNNISQALERLHNVQFKHKLQPLILDFSNDELFVVDANFLVYLNTHSKTDLLAIIEIDLA